MLDNDWPVLAFHFLEGDWEDNQALASEGAWSKQIIQNSFSQVLGLDIVNSSSLSPFDPLAAFNTINHGILNSLKQLGVEHMVLQWLSFQGQFQSILPVNGVLAVALSLWDASEFHCLSCSNLTSTWSYWMTSFVSTG